MPREITVTPLVCQLQHTDYFAVFFGILFDKAVIQVLDHLISVMSAHGNTEGPSHSSFSPSASVFLAGAHLSYFLSARVFM